MRVFERLRARLKRLFSSTRHRDEIVDIGAPLKPATTSADVQRAQREFYERARPSSHAYGMPVEPVPFNPGNYTPYSGSDCSSSSSYDSSSSCSSDGGSSGGSD